MILRLCPVCRQDRPIAEFQRARSGVRHRTCRTCRGNLTAGHCTDREARAHTVLISCPRPFIRRIAQAALDRRMSLAAVATELRMSPARLRVLMRGGGVSGPVFVKVCRWLGVDPIEQAGLRPSIDNTEARSRPENPQKPQCFPRPIDNTEPDCGLRRAK